MENASTKLIEEWFAEHTGDGEFAYDLRAAPYSVVGPSSSGGRIIFATKPRIVSAAIEMCEAPEEFGMVGRYGLPDAVDLRWIGEVVGPRALLFLGDMDPVDLMIFAWLRARLHPKRVVHLGVSDTYFAELQVILPESFIMRCAPSELRSLSVLEKVFPDLRETVGAKCAQLLERGHKIELEAVVSAKQNAASILRPALGR